MIIQTVRFLIGGLVGLVAFSLNFYRQAQIENSIALIGLSGISFYTHAKKRHFSFKVTSTPYIYSVHGLGSL
jgi:hypothetical protein